MKTTAYCPGCKNEIRRADVDFDDWMVHCGDCGAETPVADLHFEAFDDDPADNDSLPKGVTIKSGFDSMEIRFSLFSLKKIFLGLFVVLFWNGIVSIFLSLAVAAVCYNALGYVPKWLPVPGLEDGKPIMNDQVMGWGMTIFLCLFLTPFLAVGGYMLLYFLLRIVGWTKVTLAPRQCRVATGMWILSRWRNFHAQDIKSVKRAVAYDHSRTDDDNFRVELETSGTPVKFGTLLSEEQQLWLIRILKRALKDKNRNDFSQLASRLRR